MYFKIIIQHRISKTHLKTHSQVLNLNMVHHNLMVVIPNLEYHNMNNNTKHKNQNHHN